MAQLSFTTRGSGPARPERPPRSAPPTRPYRRTSPFKRRQAIVAWMFALPFVAVFGVFMLLPLISSFLMSFTDFRSSDMQTPTQVDFVAFGQYVHLFEDPAFRRALLNTGYFVLLGIPLTMVVALALAVALNNGITRLRTVFRLGFYTPVVTSIVAVAVVWRYVLQSDGLVNTLLGHLGIHGPDWLHSTTWAMPSLILMAAWRNMGTLMIIFLAGLQNVPQELHEAAAIDGAGPMRRFVSVTLPLLRPTLLLGAVMLSVGYLQFFEEPFVMTQGGPLNSTLSATYYTFKQFGFGNYGQASAASYVLFVAVALLSLVQFRSLRAKD